MITLTLKSGKVVTWPTKEVLSVAEKQEVNALVSEFSSKATIPVTATTGAPSASSKPASVGSITPGTQATVPVVTPPNPAPPPAPVLPSALSEQEALTALFNSLSPEEKAAIMKGMH